MPVDVPAPVKVGVSGRAVNVEGPKGKLTLAIPSGIEVQVAEGGKQVRVERASDERAAKAAHGTIRALIQNMLEGVTKGYEKQLEVVGVGYVCSIKGKNVTLRVGYANEVQIPIPVGLEVTCPDQTHITIKGCDKQLVGQFAAAIRSARKPEPYKGKGVRYVGEHVKIKPGKAAG